MAPEPKYPGPQCWRCKDELVIRLRAGHAVVCPVCFDRPDRRHLKAEALARTAPKARYRPTRRP